MKMLQEAERLGITPEADVVGARLAQALSATQQWQETCREAVTKLKVGGHTCMCGCGCECGCHLSPH